MFDSAPEVQFAIFWSGVCSFEEKIIKFSRAIYFRDSENFL
jgi:hypothetical protein